MNANSQFGAQLEILSVLMTLLKCLVSCERVIEIYAGVPALFPP